MVSKVNKNRRMLLFALVVILIIFGITGGILLKQKFNKDTSPHDWKSFTGRDFDFGIQITVSLPPGCNFAFSGSEWDLGCGEHEKWNYANSVYRGNDEENPKNHYSGEPVQQWYQQYLNRDKILTVKKHPLNEGQYLEVQVKLADSGKTETNYLYVQDNILHILRPLVIDESSSVVNKNIGIIFASLKSVILTL